MPKVTMTFNIPEEQSELTLAQKGGEFHSILHHLDEAARSALKYGHDWEKPEEVLEWLRDTIAEETDLWCVE
jgi:hypothetical protein